MKLEATLQNLSEFKNKSLLIVDDDNPFRERLARAMEKKGFEVFQAESVQKGIESVKVKNPGFAVVDLLNAYSDMDMSSGGCSIPLTICNHPRISSPDGQLPWQGGVL